MESQIIACMICELLPSTCDSYSGKRAICDDNRETAQKVLARLAPIRAQEARWQQVGGQQMNESDLVKLRVALEKETLTEAIKAVEKALREMGWENNNAVEAERKRIEQIVTDWQHFNISEFIKKYGVLELDLALERYLAGKPK